MKGAAASRRHAEALTVEDLEQIMDWSNLQCPPEKLQHCKRSPDKEENFLKLKHGLMRGFISIGWTLWSR